MGSIVGNDVGIRIRENLSGLLQDGRPTMPVLVSYLYVACMLPVPDPSVESGPIWDRLRNFWLFSKKGEKQCNGFEPIPS